MLLRSREDLIDAFSDAVFWSRLQFGLTSLFHILWPVLTIGLSIFLVAMEVLWLKTKDPAYYHHAHFWGRLFILNFGIGVVTGFPLQFQLGTNWGPYAASTGDFIGNILGFEAAMAFMLEAAFLGIMIFGWKRVSPGIHLFATCMVALGASLSAFWIMVASAWMQSPAGAHLENGVVVMDDYFKAVFNPSMPSSVLHMWFACLMVSLFVVGGISAWFILKNRHSEFFLKTFRLAFFTAIVVTPLQIFLGDLSGVSVAEHQPTKLAAMEGHWDTNDPGSGASWALLAWPDQEQQKNLWAIEIPNVLSLITTHSFTGEVRGLRDFPRDEQPPVWITFYAFRIMVLIGLGLFGLMLWTAWAWRKGRLQPARIGAEKWLLRAWVIAVPLPYIAVDMGWITRCVGRQPWIVQGLIRTEDGAARVAVESVMTTVLGYSIVYTALLTLFLVFAARIIRKGPDFSTPVPEHKSKAPIRTETGAELHDKRPVQEG